MAEKTDIYKLEMNELTVLDFDACSYWTHTVRRVPGGWIYTSSDQHRGIMGSVFVPFCEEGYKRPL